MRWYSDFPDQRARQITADAVAGVLILLAIVPGVLVGGLIAGLGAIGRGVADAGSGFKNSMDDLGGSLSSIPLIGESIAAPVGEASAAGQALVDAGETFQATVGVVAVLVGLILALGPIVIILVVWLVPRIRRARRAAELRAALAGDGAIDLWRFVELEYRRAGVRAGVRR